MKEGTYFIGIAGASASGKSTLSERLEVKLKSYKLKVIHMDDYYKEESQRPRIKGITSGKEYVDDNHPMAFDLCKCHRDMEKAKSEGWNIVIVEGILALWDEKICELLDLKIYVDCDPNEMMSRRISRNLSFGQDLGEITERYVQAVQPRQKEYVEPTKWKADIILNGFLMPQKTMDMVAQAVDIVCVPLPPEIEEWLRAIDEGAE